MRAWRVHSFGHFRDVLGLESCDAPAVPDEGVRVDVTAAALNFPDLLAIAGRYQVKAPLPFIPGHECAGVVEAVGHASRFRVGQRVIVNGLAGGFAEQIAAPDVRVFPVPDAMSDEEAAALCVVYQTGWFALQRRASLAPGEVLLVHGGAGGVGTAAIQLGVALGARVIATAGTDAKRAICRDLGAHHAIDHGETLADEVRALTGGRGADVVFDPIGGDVFDRSTRCVAWEGRIVVVGFASGRIPEVAANRILLKNIAIVGLHWGEYYRHAPELIHAAHARLLELHARGVVRPLIGGRHRFDDLPAALTSLEDRSAIGKVVVTR